MHTYTGESAASIIKGNRQKHPQEEEIKFANRQHIKADISKEHGGQSSNTKSAEVSRPIQQRSRLTEEGMKESQAENILL